VFGTRQPAALAGAPDAGAALPGRNAAAIARGTKTLTYFLRRAPDRFAARKEIPARMAFCCTAAAVRPSFFAT